MSIAYISANAATVTNSTKTVSVAGEYVDFSQAQDYLAAIDNGLYVLRVASGTAPDSNGDSTLTLVDTWQGATLSSKSLFIFPTFAKIYESVTAMNALNDVTRGVLVKFNDLLSETSPTIDIPLGQTSSAQVVPYGYLVNEVQSLINELGNEVQGLLTTINGSWDSLKAMTKQDFFALAEKRIRDNIGSGDAHVNMDFDDYFTTPANVANEITLEARTRMVNGIEYFAPQITLTLPAASDVETLVSNQTLIMFETKVVNVSASDVFYVGADGDSTPVTWSSLTYLQQTEYMQDFKNNVYNDNDELKQYVFNHVVTNLAQDYAKGDPQAIIDAGYTQGVVGDTYVQWTKTDVEAVPLCKIQRRNQGAYHPVYNPEGCGNTYTRGTQHTDWWEADLSGFWTSTALCFDFKTHDNNGTSVNLNASRGAIAAEEIRNGRPDGKFYDAIYASDVFDLRMSSRRVPQSQIRKEGRAKAIAGELRGFEGVPFSISRAEVQTSVATNSGGLFLDNSTGNYEIGDYCWVISSDKTFRLQILTLNSGTTSIGWDTIRWGTFNRAVETLYVIVEKVNLHSQANPTWTDIIGDPARITATFPDGVEGQWIPEIPTGVSLEFSLNRKALNSSVPEEYTFDNGVIWYAGSSTISTTTNSKTAATSATAVILWHYETQANFTEDTVNQEVLDLGGIHATSEATNKIGYDLVVSLIGKVPTNTNAPSRGDYALDTFTLNTDRKPNTNPANVWSHKVITLGSDNNSPAAKFIDYLSETNGVAELCYVYKEMIYDDGADNGAEFIQLTMASSMSAAGNGNKCRIVGGILAGMYTQIVSYTSGSFQAMFDVGNISKGRNGDIIGAGGEVVFEVWDGNGWGDDNQFQIVNNQESFTDDNGNTGLRGKAKVKLQYFIDRSY